jgi:hypothetical protein
MPIFIKHSVIKKQRNIYVQNTTIEELDIFQYRRLNPIHMSEKVRLNYTYLGDQISCLKEDKGLYLMGILLIRSQISTSC